MYRKLSEDECLSALQLGDFSPTLTAGSSSVAIILTQSWCPQWTWMRSYLADLSKEPDLDIYWVEYDREPFFETFMNFKENTFGNRAIPYVRYYKNGVLKRESNYIDRGGFQRFLKG